jgi:N-acetylglutamate synthase-like GNAT family acetyltransferase
MKLTYKDWSLEYVVEWDTLFVLSIFVEERRQGTATQLMNMLLEKAREKEINVIELPAMSFDAEEWMETEELKSRCERMWFETIEKYSIWENKGYAMRMEL